MNTRSLVGAYGCFSSRFIVKSGARQDCSFLSLRFICVIEMIVLIALSPCENSDINTRLGRKLFGLEYAEDVMLTNEDPDKLQIFLDCLNDYVDKFGTHFPLSECKMSLPDYIGPKMNVIFAKKGLSKVGTLCYTNS